MEFWVKLLVVEDTKNQDARDDLQANCTHITHDYWLFEGDEEALDDGITFSIIGEEAISGTGDLTKSQLKVMLLDTYGLTDGLLS